MRYPTVVAFDLDGTIWSNWLDPSKFRSRNDLEIHGNVIRNKWNQSQHVRVSDRIYWIIKDLVNHGVKIAICSRNYNKSLCDRAMWLIKIPMSNGSSKPLTDLLTYNEIEDVPKENHFERIRRWSGAGYDEMLLFDDQAPNNEVEMWKGVTFYKVDGRRGMTDADFFEGCAVWNRNKDIRCQLPFNNPGLTQARQIGWVGTDRATAQRYAEGKRRLKSSRPSRWGWGLYVADDPSIAAEFARWGRDPNDTDNLFVCKVFVRDFEVFRNMNKVWVPENGSIPQTNSSLGDASIAESQIDRDKRIEEQFGVRKPYILFSRHHWMDFLSMTWRKNHKGRFSEMVVPPQVQDALFYSEPINFRNAQFLIGRNALEGFDFRHKLSQWNITANGETIQDFQNNGESFS